MQEKKALTTYIEQLNAIKQKLTVPDEFPKPTKPTEVYPDKVPEITHLPNEVPGQIPIENPEPDVPNEHPDEKNSL